jgi:RNA polymerase sigma-70 factor (ECF subfamily)
MIFSLQGNRNRNKSDEQLLEEYCSGRDLKILGELYSEYMHLVYGVCLKYFKDREKSMDGVMQIFEKLIYEIPKHKINNFRSWLYVVTKNYCLMQIRSEKSQKEKMVEWINDSMIFMENTVELHPIDENEHKSGEALRECIEKLKDEQKLCITLFYYENKCYSEIAASLKIDEKKVKSYLQNGKRNLKICLEEKNDGKKEK